MWSTSNYGAIADPVNDPFAILVTDQSNATSIENAQVGPGLFPDKIGLLVSEEDNSPTSGTKRKRYAVSSRKKFMKLSTGGRVGAYQDDSIYISTTQ